MSNRAAILSTFRLERWSTRYWVILEEQHSRAHGMSILSTKSGLWSRISEYRISVHNQKLSISLLFLCQTSLLFYFFIGYGTISKSLSSHQQLYSFAVKLTVTRCTNFMWYPILRETISETKYDHDWHYSSLRKNVRVLIKMPSRSTTTHMSIYWESKQK